MVRFGPVLVACGMAAMAVAGCLGDEGGAAADPWVPSRDVTHGPTVLGTDPQGDGRRLGVQTLFYGTAYENVCAGLPDEVRTACATAGGALAPLDEPTELPGPPELDILSVSLSETADLVIIDLELAAVRPDMAAWVDADDSVNNLGWAFYWATPRGGLDIVGVWIWDEGPGFNEYAYYYPVCMEDPVGVALCDEYDDGCNWWWWCELPISHVWIAGEPGHLILEVPRWRMQGGGYAFADVEGGYYGVDYAAIAQADASPLRDGDGTPRVEVHVEPLGATVPYFGRWDQRDVVDLLYVSESPYLFQTPPGPAPAPEALPTQWTHTAGNVPYAEMDIIGSAWKETPDTLTWSIQLAEVRESPSRGDFFWGVLNLPSGAPYDVWWWSTDGGAYQVGSSVPSDYNHTTINSYPVSLRVEAGTPGWVHMDIARSDIEPLRRGDQLTMAWGGMWREHDGLSLPLGPAGGLEAWTARQYDDDGDLVVMDWPVIRYDSDPEPGSAAYELLDEQGDVAEPLGWTDAAAGERYDLAGLLVRGLDPTSTEVTLSVWDLSTVEVPTGYDATLHGAAVQTEAASFLVGFLKTADGAQEFYCSQDTLLFADAQADPRDVVRVDIPGFFTIGQAAEQAQGASAGGSIVFQVPHACLGQTDAGPFDAAQIMGGTFLIRDVPGGPEIHVVDDTEPRGPVPFGRAAPTTATAWYVDPFDIPNFWDIAGIAFAVLVAVVTAVLVLRRRRRLDRYLRDVRHALAEPDESQRIGALEKVRSRAAEAMRRGRISDAQFSIVERRLEGQLSGLRRRRVADIFGSLPHDVVLQIQDALGDGILSAVERRRIERILVGARVPAAERTRVLGRLDVLAGA